MEERKLKLVADNSSRKRHILLLLACLIVIFGMGIYFLLTDFSIQRVEIKGNDTYTNTEILNAMKKDGYINNTLLMVVQNQVFGQTYLPFIDKVSMSYDDSHILKVKVKEKLRAGVFKYMNEYVYFNENGIAVESRNTLFNSVPIVTGVKFDQVSVDNKILENKVPVKKQYFNTIVSITKKIAAYDIPITEIHFDGVDDITLHSSKYRIYLGSSSYLDGKMSRIAPILESISSNYKKGTIDMHLYTDERPVITLKDTK